VCVGTAPTVNVAAPLRPSYRPIEGTPGAGRDYNLNPRRWQVLQMQSDLPWTRDWRQHCAQASEAARAYVIQLEAVQARTDQATRGLQAQHDTRAAQLASRIARLEGAARTAEIAEMDAEARAHHRLLSAVQSPACRLDVCGAVFVSAHTPFAQ